MAGAFTAQSYALSYLLIFVESMRLLREQPLCATPMFDMRLEMLMRCCALSHMTGLSYTLI